VEWEFIAVLFQVDGWGDGVAHFAENHSDAYKGKKKNSLEFVALLHKFIEFL
jgi:hypothetical protein